MIPESTFSIGTEEYFKVEWTPVNHAGYYFVSMYWSKTESFEVIETTHTSIVRTRKPTQFSVSSVNECGVKSTATGRWMRWLATPLFPKASLLQHYVNTFKRKQNTLISIHIVREFNNKYWSLLLTFSPF